ncbi:chitooligosaccharide deacetylase [Paenibacillus selenitireducens]|uniref:Chitooligosaccharide deacetylase n=1 Tax=Paenibacillus selenitireducens TaxID=1324314 RepID=A0A1T2X4L0_9BACL|nr:chitooligosaccharide deacetylase [Paenibacillus selenitireducens]
MLLTFLICCTGCSQDTSTTSQQTSKPSTTAITNHTSKLEQKPARETSKRVTTRKSQSRAHKSYAALSRLRHKYPQIFKNNGSSQSRKIALTFDDVPDAFTNKVLDTLKKYNVKATFFIVGYKAEAHPEIVRRMVREGHLVGNHSYNHPLLTKIPMAKFERQILRTDAILYRIVGYHPKFIRPPYGEINEQQVRWAGRQGYIIVNWNVDSQDWRGLSASKVSKNILSTTKPGSIILQHAGGNEGGALNGTLEALPYIIERLERQNYQFVTLTEMFHIPRNR